MFSPLSFLRQMKGLQRPRTQSLHQENEFNLLIYLEFILITHYYLHPIYIPTGSIAYYCHKFVFLCRKWQDFTQTPSDYEKKIPTRLKLCAQDSRA